MLTRPYTVSYTPPAGYTVARPRRRRRVPVVGTAVPDGDDHGRPSPTAPPKCSRPWCGSREARSRVRRRRRSIVASRVPRSCSRCCSSRSAGSRSAHSSRSRTPAPTRPPRSRLTRGTDFDAHAAAQVAIATVRTGSSCTTSVYTPVDVVAQQHDRAGARRLLPAVERAAARTPRETTCSSCARARSALLVTPTLRYRCFRST